MDYDGDGFGAPDGDKEACEQPEGYVADNTDCNDTIYSSTNDDCVENDETIYFADSDNDGYGDPGNTIDAASQPAGYVTDNTDCDDNDATIHPNRMDCAAFDFGFGMSAGGDGVDQDCDGLVDEDTCGLMKEVGIAVAD